MNIEVVGNTGADIQRAIDACTAGGGGRVRIPGGAYRLDVGLVMPAIAYAIPVLTPAVTLEGDGVNVTVIHTLDPVVDLLRIERSNVTVKGMLLQGSQGAGKGRGVVIKDATNGAVVSGIHMENVYVAATGQHALDVPEGFPHLLGQPAYDQVAVACTYDRCVFDSNLAPGSDLVRIGRWNTLQRFTGCRFTNFKGSALLLDGADATSCRDCAFENGDNSRPWVDGYSAPATLLDHCYFEDHASPSVAKFTRHDRVSTGWAERDCMFRRRQ